MRKALSSLFALLVSALLISIIVSFFMRENFETIPLKVSGAPVKLTRRIQDTAFAVNIEHISRYDFNWLGQKLQLPKDSIHRILPIPLNFYSNNQLSHIEYPVAGMDVIDSNCNLLADRIPALRRYFRSLHVPAADKKKVPLIPVAFRALPESITLRYSDNSPQAVKCLTAQVLALGELGFLQDGYTLVLPALQSVRVNLAPYERAALLAQAGRNAYLALAELYRKNPALKVRLLLSNMVPYAQAQLLPFNELVGKFVALTPEELTAVKNAAVANNGAVVYIPDLASRIALAIDTAVIWQLWQTPRVPYYKDNAGEPILYEELLLQLRRALTETDAAGTLLERKLKAIYASYARDNDEKRKWGESINLPYQRASSERLMKQQLQLLFDLYDFSAVGLEPDTFISLEMPARQHFPLLHTLVRPLARKLGLDGKKDGATEAEIEDSLNYIRSSLAQTGK